MAADPFPGREELAGDSRVQQAVQLRAPALEARGRSAAKPRVALGRRRGGGLKGLLRLRPQPAEELAGHRQHRRRRARGRVGEYTKAALNIDRH